MPIPHGTLGTLDASAYPHLLDTVITHASPLALRNLSLTCRALHARLTPLLYTHVALRASRFSGHVVAPSAPFPRLRALRPGVDEPPLHLSHTRVLDLCAAYGYGRPAAFPGLRVLRHPLAYRTWPMPRFCEALERATTSPTSAGENEDGEDGGGEDGREWLPPERWEPITDGIYVAYLHLTHPRWHEDHDVPGLYIDPPEGTRRLVLHLAWDPAYPRVRYADVAFGEVALHADIVVVFEPVRSEAEAEGPGAFGGGGRRVGAGAPTPTDTAEAASVPSVSASTSTSVARRRRPSHSPTRPSKRARRASHTPTAPSGHARASSSDMSDTPHTNHTCTHSPGMHGPHATQDTYHDALRAHGIFGNLCYALMQRVIDTGCAVTLVGVEACTRRELFLPPDEAELGKGTRRRRRSDTLAAARAMLGAILDSVLVLPEEFGWDCIPAWRSMARGQGEGWFDGQVATGLGRHFRFESVEEWRGGGEGMVARELRQLESGRIAWEEYEERMRASAGVTESMVARFG